MRDGFFRAILLMITVVVAVLLLRGCEIKAAEDSRMSTYSQCVKQYNNPVACTDVAIKLYPPRT